MQPTLIFAILLTLAAADAAPEHAAGAPYARGVMVLAATAGLATVAIVIARVAAIQLAVLEAPSIQPTRGGRGGVLQWFERWAATQRLLLVGFVALVSLGVGWPQVVKYNLAVGGVLCDELLILVPLAVCYVCQCWGRQHVETVLDLQFAAQQAGAASPLRAASARRSAAKLWDAAAGILRMAREEVGVILVPTLALLGAHDLLQWLRPHWTAEQQVCWVYLPMLSGFVLGLPWILRMIWPTCRLPAGPLRSALLAAAREMKLPLREILIWQTKGAKLNAAVAGWLPRLRYVFVTDGLLRELPLPALTAVIRHEAAHVRCRHAGFRLVLIGFPLAALFAVQRLWPGSVAAVVGWFGEQGLSPTLQAGLLVPLAAAAYLRLVLSGFARRLEHEADLVACLDQERFCREPRFCRERIAHLLSALGCLSGDPAEYQRASWLHPSLASRVALLRATARDGAHGVHFLRRTRLLVRFTTTLAAACLLAALAA